MFNNIDTVEEAIHSILNQSYSNIELLITDDFSDDSSYDICKLISKKDNRIKLFRNNTNLGLTKTLNIMLNASTGYYIARQDADDISYLERIEKQIEALEKNNFDVIYTRAIKESNRLIPGFSYYLPLKILSRYKNPCVHGTLLTKKKNILT